MKLIRNLFKGLQDQPDFSNISNDSRYYISLEADNASDRETQYLQIVTNYIQYYGVRARRCKYQYYTLSVIKFTAVGLIPVLQKMEELSWFAGMAWMVSAASALCLLMEAVIGLMKLRSKWSLYRNTYNALLSVQRKYLVKRAEKTDMVRFNEFVDQVESIIGVEADKWKETVSRKESDEKSS